MYSVFYFMRMSKLESKTPDCSAFISHEELAVTFDSCELITPD